MTLAVPPFSDLLPLDRFEALVAAVAEGGDGPYARGLNEIAKPALRTLLGSRRNVGLLAPVPNSGGRKTPFLDAWNALVAGTSPQGNPGYPWESVLSYLAHNTVGRAAHSALGRGQPASVNRRALARRVHASLAADMDAGRISPYELDPQTCFETGETFLVSFEGWNPTFRERDPFGRLSPMRPPSPPRTMELAIPFETGEVLVADWFHLKEFTETVDAVRRPVLGVVAMHEMHLRDYAAQGFVSVSVGNAAVSVFERDGCIVVGTGEGGRRIETDYWGVTIIDRARLVAIVAGRIGAAEAEALVESYLSGNAVPRLRAKPGTHRLYVRGDTESFAESFRPEGVDLAGITPFLVLSDRRLSYSDGPLAEQVP